MESNMESLFEEINCSPIDFDGYSLANAPTPNVMMTDMNDFIDINDADLVGFDSNVVAINDDEYPDNEVIIESENNNISDNTLTIELSHASEEQMRYSVTHEDIIQMNGTRVRAVNVRKRDISLADSEEEEEDESIDVKTRKTGKRYDRNQNGDQKQSKRMKCMSRNAIAARENREKKKRHIETLEKRLALLTKENAKIPSLEKKSSELESENTYLKAIIANTPQIAALIQHMSSAPNVQLVGTSLGTEDLKKASTSKPIDTNVIRKSNRIAAKVDNPGICLHINGTNKMSLELCHKCSEASKKFMKTFKDK